MTRSLRSSFWIWPLVLGAPLASAQQKKLSLAELAALEWKLEQGSATLTTNPDVAARKKALGELSGIQDPRVTAPLATALKEDPDASVRLKAAETIAALKTPEAKGLLTIASTADPDEKVRTSAAGLLKAFPKKMAPAGVNLTPRPFKPPKGKKVDAALIKATLALPSGDARLWAVGAMAQTTFNERAALAETHLFKDPSARVRAEAAKLLHRLQQKKSLPTLIKAVSDGSALVRFEVARLVAEFDDPGALSVLQRVAAAEADAEVKAEIGDLLEPTTRVGKRLLRQRIQKLSSAKEPERLEALNELASVSHWRAMLPMSCTLLNDRSVAVRSAAARVLTNMHDSTILTAIRVAAVLEPDPKLKALVRKLVGEMVKRVGALVKQVQSEDASQRVLAARFLGQAAYPQGLDALVQAAKDKEVRVRLAAVQGLGNFVDPKAEAALKLAGADADARVRRAVDTFFKQQARLQKYRAFFKDSNRVVTKTGDKDPKWRANAALALGVAGAESAVGTLVELLLQDKDEQVRLAAAWALVLVASEQGEAALKKAASKDASERVRLTARKYLVIEKVNVDDLIRQLGENEASARQDAAEALSLRPKGQILDPMVRAAMCDPEARVRAAAMRGLARIGNPLARTAIKVALSRDPDPDVRQVAYMMYILSGGK